MHATEQTLGLRLTAALVAAFGPQYHGWDPQLRAATNPGLGHFQTNLPLRLATPTGLAPQQVGRQLLAALTVEDICLPRCWPGRGSSTSPCGRSS